MGKDPRPFLSLLRSGAVQGRAPLSVLERRMRWTMKRRTFLESAAALAAGAAVGIPIRQVKAHAPVQISFELFPGSLITANTVILTDEARDLFRICVIGETDLLGRSRQIEATWTEMSLGWIRKVVKESPRSITSEIAFHTPAEEGRIQLDAAARNGRLCFWEPGKE